jgi:hypothetical protein
MLNDVDIQIKQWKLKKKFEYKIKFKFNKK